ncbi:MAG: peptidoglycan-binding protein [Longimicrobiaceae bacterium]
MCGSDVAELMQLLMAQGHLTSAQMNSNATFTVSVENAVRRFQRAHRITADGKVGRVTARLLRRAR